jgi:CheY-like chemotaxis protein
MIRRLLTENIELEIAVESELFHIKADRSQIEQAIVNLTVNARDAMPEGGKLTIRAQNVRCDETKTWRHGSVQPGRYVTLTFSDTGTGMNADTLSRIFEPFFTTKGPGKGTGLGLSTVYGVVKQSGGAISVETEPNRGSAFKVFIPACEEEMESCISEQMPAVPCSPASGNETILLVEDQVAIREVASDYLMRLGYNVLAAPDGEAAIKLAQTHKERIDLLITDMVMPNMGGRELAARLSEMFSVAKILYISGYPDLGVAGVAHSSLDGEILRKPFSFKTLASRARLLLDSGAGVERNQLPEI